MDGPANPAAHAFLTANGYEYEHCNTLMDDGDAENGPHLTGGEWDEYTSAEDRVFIFEGKAEFEVRDLLLEEAEAAWSGEGE
jgi:hypothetical protein